MEWYLVLHLVVLMILCVIQYYVLKQATEDYLEASQNIEDLVRDLREGIIKTDDLTDMETHYICQGMKIAANIIEQRDLTPEDVAASKEWHVAIDKWQQ